MPTTYQNTAGVQAPDGTDGQSRNPNPTSKALAAVALQQIAALAVASAMLGLFLGVIDGMLRMGLLP